jgi:hypothetical protein
LGEIRFYWKSGGRDRGVRRWWPRRINGGPRFYHLAKKINKRLRKAVARTEASGDERKSLPSGCLA